MKLKNVLTLSFGLQLICGQVSYPGMRSWFHPQSMAMAGGGNSISSMESDRLNPAALNSKGRVFSVSMIRYPGEISAESSSLLLPRESKMLSINLRHIGYGIFEGKDSNNEPVQNYSSSDTWLSMSSSSSDTNKIYTFGWNSGVFISNLDNYQSIIITGGLGLLITLPNDIGKFSLSVQNMGLPIQKYTGADEPPPVWIAAGGSKKLAYLPLELAVDAVYFPGGKSTRIHISGLASLPYHFKLRIGSSTVKFDQQTSYSIARDVLSDTGVGLSYMDGEYAFDIGMYMYGNGGWASGLGFGIKF